MTNISILDNLQTIIEDAELLVSLLPEEAMTDNWIQESVDNALGELERTALYLKDKYEVDIFEGTETETRNFFSEADLDDEFSSNDIEDIGSNFDDEETYD